jgi:glycosyltransferase involved in cell wall biosynthesis
MMPAISVLIPTFRYARYLPEAIESVLRQDFPDFELLVADDASPDATGEIGAAYARRDKRVRFFRHANTLGMVANWNWCLQQARGTHIKYLMADDLLRHDSALGLLHRALLAHPGATLASSARLLINEHSHPTGCQIPLGRRDRLWAGQRLIARSVDWDAKDINAIGEPSATLFRRSDAGQGFDPSYGQLVDVEMWFRLLQRGDLAYIGEPLCSFRQHPLQQTEVNRGQGLHQREEIRLCRTYGTPGALPYALFQKLTRLEREQRPGCEDLVAALRREFSARERAVFGARYALARPWIKLHRSALKRLTALRSRATLRACTTARPDASSRDAVPA